MPKHYKKARGNNRAKHSGKVTGPNAPNISSSKKGGAGNGQTTPESAKSSYKKPKGG